MIEIKLYDFIMKKPQSQLNNVAIICEEKRFTYLEVDKYIKKLSSSLRNCGIKGRCKIGLIVSNPLDFLLLFLSSNYCNGIIVPIYQNTGMDKICKLINEFHIEYIISNTAIGVYEKIGQVDLSNNSYDIYEVKYKNNDVIDEDVCLLMLTSGTTNIPKGVMLTFYNIKSNIESISKYLNLTMNDKILLIKNLNHISSIVGELLVSLYNGCCLVLTTRFPHVENILNILEKQKITTFFAVPTILNQMIEFKKFNNYDLCNLRIVNFYGSKMSYENISKLFEMFPKKNLIYSYGLTEASPRVTYIEGSDLLNKLKSVGKPVDNVTVRICSENGDELGICKEGEIVVEGPNVMLGYYNNENLTKNTIRNGLLHTGDLGYLDEEGYLYITGRKDNMITIAGKNIHPEEIEEVLTTYPNILEALVAEEKEANDVYSLTAYVVYQGDNKLAIINVLKHCKARLEDYKIPKKIIVVDKLEKTVSGKVRRKQFFL